jgi:8-oxo-dGTP pyrophosphatase MutT (NUDIX family)
MPAIRTDIVDVYVIRQFASEWLHRVDPTIELLQLHRATGPLPGTWQPVMGHIVDGETAVAAALREVHEEIGLTPSDPHFRGLWQLEQVNPFYMAERNEIVMSPRFVTEVDTEWAPTLSNEHDAARWVSSHQALRYFMWPGQLQAVREIVEVIFRPGSITHDALRVK